MTTIISKLQLITAIAHIHMKESANTTEASSHNIYTEQLPKKQTIIKM